MVATSNTGSFTYDGIELGGERVAQEIEDTLEKLARSGQEIKKLSIVGYSLGGLIARYAIGLLYSKDWFGTVEPVNFTTFATPHLGVRTPLLGFHNHLWNVLGARTLSVSGRQLFTIDSFRDTGRPLLSVLADADSIFIAALSKFRNRVLYSNIVNDRSAVYYTTAISRIDPFAKPDKVKINYLKGKRGPSFMSYPQNTKISLTGYEPVILDADNPILPEEPKEPPTFFARLVGSSQALLTRIPVFALLLVFIPLGSVVFLVNSGIQSLRSRQRIRLHEEGKTGIGLGGYRIPLMVEDVRSAVEGAFENMNAGQSQEYLPAGSEVAASPTDVSFGARRSSVSARASSRPDLSEAATDETEKSLDTTDSTTELIRTQSRQPEFPVLALTSDQFAMIEALNNVGFRKFPVYIHNVRHSHAAIIVRWPRKAFDEGKVVVRHWLDEEFEI